MGIENINFLIDPDAKPDPHISLSPTQAREQGCTCEFGCKACGNPMEMMDACPSFVPCVTDSFKMGRAADPACPLTNKEK